MTFIGSDITKHDGKDTLNNASKNKEFVLVHFSDLHIACIKQIKCHDLINKRFLGYLRWRLYRGAKHQNTLLDILKKDIQKRKPNHIAITGDLTHLSLPVEFKKARQWLQLLGTPARVTVVPGNHDAYVRTDWQQSFACWLDYMISDNQYRQSVSISGFDNLFPTLRVRGRIALIGICTAHPSAPHLATGSIGNSQLEKLEPILKQTADRNLFRIMLVHHPPISGIVNRRKRLTDASSLYSLLVRYGTELILHGHSHEATFNTLNTPAGLTLVAGAPSATSSNNTGKRMARYYVYKIISSGNGWKVNISEHLYTPNDICFTLQNEQYFFISGAST